MILTATPVSGQHDQARKEKCEQKSFPQSEPVLISGRVIGTSKEEQKNTHERNRMMFTNRTPGVAYMSRTETPRE